MLTHSLFLTVHDGLQLLKVSQLDLQLLHLSLHQQSHQGLDLPLFYCCQVLRTQEENIKIKFKGVKVKNERRQVRGYTVTQLHS